MKPSDAAASEHGADIDSNVPVDARRRVALARLGLAATAAYAAPVILKLNPASAMSSHCRGGNSNCGGGDAGSRQYHGGDR